MQGEPLPLQARGSDEYALERSLRVAAPPSSKPERWTCRWLRESRHSAPPSVGLSAAARCGSWYGNLRATGPRNAVSLFKRHTRAGTHSLTQRRARSQV